MENYSPYNGKSYLTNAYKALEINDIKQAEDILKQYLNNFFPDNDTDKLQAAILIKKSAFNDAKKLLESILQRDPLLSDVWLTLSMLYYTIFQFQESINCCEKVIRLNNYQQNDEVRNASMVKANNLYCMGDLTLAQFIIDNLLVKNPQDHDAIILKSRICNQQGNFAESRQLLLPIVKTISERELSGQAYYILARAQYKFGYQKEFEEALEESVRLGDEFGVLWHRIRFTKSQNSSAIQASTP